MSSFAESASARTGGDRGRSCGASGTSLLLRRGAIGTRTRSSGIGGRETSDADRPPVAADESAQAAYVMEGDGRRARPAAPGRLGPRSPCSVRIRTASTVETLIDAAHEAGRLRRDVGLGDLVLLSIRLSRPSRAAWTASTDHRRGRTGSSPDEGAPDEGPGSGVTARPPLPGPRVTCMRERALVTVGDGARKPGWSSAKGKRPRGTNAGLTGPAR